jgi:hypothetical protein
MLEKIGFPSRHVTLGVLLLGIIAVGPGCSPAPAPGEVEEEVMATEEVPEVVRESAQAVAVRVGSGNCETWFWDNEDRDWECEFVGLSRAAELDILPDGGFSELELVYDITEVESALAEEATYIRDRCRDAPDVLIELSLRHEEHLDDLPDLAEAWEKSGVVLEFQCPDGTDYEIDARHKRVMKRVDDKRDASDHAKKDE